MSAMILYWSLSGSTKRVAEAIAGGLRAHGVECALRDLRDGIPDDTGRYEILGVGYPVHYYRPPDPVMRAIHALGRLDGRAVFAFCLAGTYRGAGMDSARAALRGAGGTEIGAFACHGQGDFYPYVRLGWRFSPGHPNDRDLEEAQAFGASLPKSQAGSRRAFSALSLPPADPPTHPVYAVERFLASPSLVRTLHYRFFRADPDTCTRCGRCALRCPTHAIWWERGELPIWGPACMLCLTCVMTCPEQAVICPLDWPILRPFLRWNVDRALRDPALENERVELRRGKVVKAGPPR